MRLVYPDNNVDLMIFIFIDDTGCDLRLMGFFRNLNGISEASLFQKILIYNERKIIRKVNYKKPTEYYHPRCLTPIDDEFVAITAFKCRTTL